MKSFKTAAVVAGVVLAFAAVFFHLLVKPILNSSAGKQSQLRTGVVESRDIVHSIKLRGKITASKEVPIYSEASGQIIKLFVREGSEVKKGDPLLQVDPTQLTANIEKQKMLVEKAAITLRNDESDTQRKESLFQDRLIPEVELIEAKKAFELAKLDYQMAKKELDALEHQLAKVNIRSPIDGIVTKQDVEEGEVIVISGDQGGGKLLLTITEVGDKKIELKVSEVERSYLKLGKEVRFWLDSAPSVFYPGKISGMSASSISSKEGSGGADESNHFKADVEMISEAGKQDDIPLGANVNVEVIIEEVKGAISIPVEGIFYGSSGSFVYKVKGSGKYEKIPVVSGISDTQSVEIKSGLNLGELVYLDDPTVSGS